MTPVFIHSLINRVKAFISIQWLSFYIHHSPKYRVRKIRDGVYLGCFKVFIVGAQDYEVSYKGLKFWTKADDEPFEFFLRKIRDNEGMVKFERKADGLFEEITPETLEYMQVEGFGFDFYDVQSRLMPTNTDLFFIKGKRKNMQVVIARLSNDEVEIFMFFHKLTRTQKKELLDDIVRIKLDSPNKFDPDPTEKIFGEYIPVSKRGLGPDYSKPGLEKHLYGGNPKNANIKIEMSGNLAEDFKRAYAKAGIDTSDPALEDYVWHHLDDMTFDENGIATCTMQLVKKTYHHTVVVKSLKGMIQDLDDIVVAGKHIGSVALWEALYGVPYK